MPERIQPSRRKGWRLPENAVVVARPSKWGNPFRVGCHDYMTIGRCMGLFRLTSRGVWSPPAWIDGLTDWQVSELYALHRSWMKRFSHPIEDARSFLRGKDLACWCPLGSPCHADVLLEIANG